MIKSLLNSPNKTVAMKTMQFLNAFTKDYYGRNYLSCQAAVKNSMVLLRSPSLD